MKLFKATLFIAALFMTAFTATAQFSIGPMLVYGTDTDLGFGVKAEFGVTDAINVSPSFAVLSSTSVDISGIKFKTSLSELNLDGHFPFTDNGSTSFYGLAGLNVGFISVKIASESNSSTEVGLNLGVGSKFSISDAIGGFAQAKYGIGGIDQLGINAGVYFSFGS